MKENIASCVECDESKSILHQVCFSIEMYLCSDCYNRKYGNDYFLKKELEEEYSRQETLVPNFIKN